MARVLMCMPPLIGHINPAQAVARELHERGHSIAWAIAGSIADEYIADGEYRFHLPLNFSTDIGKAAAQVRGLESVRFFFENFCLPLAEATLLSVEDVVDKFRPDLIFCDHQMLSGAIVARKRNIPWLTSATTSASIVKVSPIIEDWIERQLLRLQWKGGLRVPVRRPDLSPSGIVVFTSEQLLGNHHQRIDANCHFVGPAFSHRQKTADFPWQKLKSGQRKILISLGTISRDRDMRFYRVMMQALADMDIQVVMVAPAELADRAPSNFIVQEQVPQIELLEHLDAVICHAGHNTVCEALAFGLPLIVAPIRDDQPVIARQVIDAGAGLPLRFGKVTPAVAREKVQQLLEDHSFTENARRLCESFRGLGGAWRAANIVESLLPRAAESIA